MHHDSMKNGTGWPDKLAGMDETSWATPKIDTSAANSTMTMAIKMIADAATTSLPTLVLKMPLFE